MDKEFEILLANVIDTDIDVWVETKERDAEQLELIEGDECI